MKPPLDLVDICKIADESNNIQLKISNATNPRQIVDLAMTTGNEISVEELRLWSNELTAPYFPWSQKGDEWRRNFFKEDAQTEQTI